VSTDDTPIAREVRPPWEPTDAELANKLRDKGAHWSVHAMWLTTVDRSDNQRLVVNVQFDERKQEFIGVCLVGAADAASLDDVFADHAHGTVGPCKTELEIKDACAKYMATWLDEAPPLPGCDCEPIHRSAAARPPTAAR